MTKPLVALDIDCCLADFDAAACDRFGWDCDRSIYNYHLRWPDKIAEVDAFVGDPSSYVELKPLRHALTYVERTALYYELVYVTARPSGLAMWRITRNWLNDHFFPYGLVEIVALHDKPAYVAELGAVWALEDNPAYIMSMGILGLKVLICDQPWNRNLPGERVNLT